MLDEHLIYKALSHPFRRRILAWLKVPGQVFGQGHIDFSHGVPTNAIQARSGLSQSTVSAHVAVLSQAGLLVSTRMGQWVFLSRNEPVIRGFAAQLAAHL